MKKYVYILQCAQMENSYQTNPVQTVLVIVKMEHRVISWQGCAITGVLITGMELSAIVRIDIHICITTVAVISKCICNVVCVFGKSHTRWKISLSKQIK